MNLLRLLKSLYKRFRRRHSLEGAVIVEYVNDVPERLSGRLYVVSRAGIPRRALFECPCRCGLRIDLNLSEERSPAWAASVINEKATLSPSVWVPKEQCGSHFFVRNNRIDWVG